MMFFFYNVQTFASGAKTAKGKVLQAMADKFSDVLVQGDDAIVKILIAMREKAREVDSQYNRGRETYVDFIEDNTGNSGIIEARPVESASGFETQPYFRIYYHKVARTATIPEAVALTKGGSR